jgi:hypothetical protein
MQSAPSKKGEISIPRPCSLFAFQSYESPLTVNVTLVLRTRMPFPYEPVKVNVNVPCVQFLLGLSVTVDLTVPPNMTSEGEIEHVELVGLPAQLNVTFPVSPPMGVTVMVYTAL